jgi:hypothetical protein
MRALWIALLILGLQGASPLAAQSRVSPEQATALAGQLLSQGQPRAARALALGLLQRDADDMRAHLILSRAERDLGNFKQAEDAGKQAWRLADAEAARFSAAMLIAQSLVAQKSHNRSQIWLRRAAQTAPNERAKARAIKDLRRIRSQNPWSYNLRFALKPSSNINNGSNADVVVIGGIPLALSGSSKALSGLGLTLGGDVEYRKNLSRTSALRFGVDVETRLYRLSEEAKSIAPDAKGSDYDFNSGKLHVAYDTASDNGRQLQSFEAQIGHYIYGGAPLSNLLWLKYNRVQRREGGVLQTISLTGEVNSRLDTHARDTGKLSATFSRAHTTKGGARFSWNLTGSATNLIGDPKFGRPTDLANNAIGGGVSYTWAKPILTARTRFSVQYEGQIFDTSRYVAGEQRQDHRGVVTLSMFFKDYEYYGFAPNLDMTYERKYSNAELFAVDSFAVNLGIRSSF